ncbi:28S ribosomal protein S36, mitochondrial [Callorhinchus milii]|nr:28S ribosomal protein S36, mitochondrial [Callorhinchus milii]|eukprot:gi/632949654/ref/XP_007890284.1/ PREDICTED: 28S ribosomal protein S36, mitochondrial [Callorhinchus milii]
MPTMGSGWGSKMAASVRVIQVVKPRAQLIKFPNRKAWPQPSVQEALKSLNMEMPESQGQHPKASSSPVPASTPVNRLPGRPDTIDLVKALPQKYRRRPVPLEEMEYIQRGGPE